MKKKKKKRPKLDESHAKISEMISEVKQKGLWCLLCVCTHVSPSLFVVSTFVCVSFLSRPVLPAQSAYIYFYLSFQDALYFSCCTVNKVVVLSEISLQKGNRNGVNIAVRTDAASMVCDGDDVRVMVMMSSCDGDDVRVMAMMSV